VCLKSAVGRSYLSILESPGFFLENSRTCKVLEKHFGPGKSWKNILENYAFFIGSNGKQAEIVNVPVRVDFYFYLFLKTVTILLHATVSAMDYTPNVVSKRCFSLYLSIPGLRKGPGKFLMGSWKSPGFFSSERVGTLSIIRQACSSRLVLFEPYHSVALGRLVYYYF